MNGAAVGDGDVVDGDVIEGERLAAVDRDVTDAVQGGIAVDRAAGGDLDQAGVGDGAAGDGGGGEIEGALDREVGAGIGEGVAGDGGGAGGDSDDARIGDGAGAD